MPMLTASQVHIDQPLTNLTVAYLQSQDNFIADKVFPNVPVDKKTNKYYIASRSTHSFTARWYVNLKRNVHL
jgi:hypothetical protein